MNILLWVLQVLAALLYGTSGVMKVFMFDKAREGVVSFGALPRKAWTILGVVELICVFGLIVPAAFRWHPGLTIAAAIVLAVESLVFIGVHIKYRETTPIVMSVILGLLMAFIAYGRISLQPISKAHMWATFNNSALGLRLEYPSDLLVPKTDAGIATTSIDFAYVGQTAEGNAQDGIRIATEDTDAQDIDGYLATIQTPFPPKKLTIGGLAAREFDELAYADQTIYLLRYNKIYIIALNVTAAEADHIKNSIAFK